MKFCSLFTYLLNIDIDIAIFSKYHIDIVSKSKSDIDPSLVHTKVDSVVVKVRAQQSSFLVLKLTINFVDFLTVE